MKLLSLSITAAVLLVAACSPTSSPTSPSAALGANVSSLSQTAELTPRPVCVPTVQAPESVTLNQTSSGGPVVLEYARVNGAFRLVEAEFQRLDGTKNVWVAAGADLNGTTYPDYLPGVDGTYRGRVRFVGACKSEWSVWATTGVDGFEADPAVRRRYRRD